MNRNWIVILVLIVIAVAGLAAPAFAQPAPGVAPQAGQPGSIFTVTAGGFSPGEQVGSWLQPPTGRALDAVPYLIADAQGFVSWQWTSPAAAQSGTWQAVTQGRVSRTLVALPFTVTGTNAPATAPQRESVTVQPQRAAPGEVLVFTLAGYERNEEVGYWPTQPDGVADTTRRKPIIVAGDGRAELRWEVPERAVAGAWVMTFRGRATQREVRVPFEVTGVARLPPASVDPQRGVPGAAFTFRAYGFRPIERLDTWLERPDGTIQRGPTGARANGDGRVVWRWTVPDDAPGGQWTMVARGQDSEHTERIGFLVERAAPPAAAMASVVPERGGYGTTFTFTATGFRPGERVGYWLNLPDGTIVRFTDELGADKDGRISWSYVAAPGTPKGRYLLALRSSQSDDIDNDISYALVFTVE